MRISSAQIIPMNKSNRSGFNWATPNTGCIKMVIEINNLYKTLSRQKLNTEKHGTGLRYL